MTSQALQMLGAVQPVTISKAATGALRFAFPVKGHSIDFLQKLSVLFIVMEPIVLQMFSRKAKTQQPDHRPVRSCSSVAQRASKLDESKTRHLETTKISETIPEGIAGEERWLVRLLFAAVDIQQLQTFLQGSVFSADYLETEFELVQREDWYVSLGYLKDDRDVNKLEAWRMLIRQLTLLADREAPEFKTLLSKIIQARDALEKQNSLRACARGLMEALELKDVSYYLRLLD